MPNDIGKLMVKLGMLILDKPIQEYVPDHADTYNAEIVLYGQCGHSWLTYYTRELDIIRSQQ